MDSGIVSMGSERITSREQFSELLRRKRREKGITYPELALRINSNSMNVANWMRGEAFPRNPAMLEALCSVLEIDQSSLDLRRLVNPRFFPSYRSYFNIKPIEHEEKLPSAEKSPLLPPAVIPNQKSYVREQGYMIRAQGEAGFMVGNSPPLREVFDQLDKIVTNPDQDSTVLILGETGTGKELVAKALHYNGPRGGRPLVCLNITNVQETLLESELFGHKKGSFTGAAADKKGFFQYVDGGTIFLDEIGSLNVNLQVKLLRVLQERYFYRVGDTQKTHFTGRVVVATKENLAQLVQEGKFREDLFYRVNVLAVKLPALRERGDDRLLLFQHFVREYNKEYGTTLNPNPTEEELKRLFDYPFPGNVRELENLVTRAIFQSADGQVRLEEVLRREYIGLELPAAAPVSVALNGEVGREARKRAFVDSVTTHIAGYTEMPALQKVKTEKILETFFEQEGNIAKTSRVLRYYDHSNLGRFFRAMGITTASLRREYWRLS